MLKRILSIIISLSLCTSFCSLAYADETAAALQGVEDENSDVPVIYEQPAVFSSETEAETTIFYLNGTKIGYGDENGSIAAPELSYGEYELKIVCISDDGSTTVESERFVFAKKVINKSVYQSFDSGYTGDVSLGSDETLFNSLGFDVWSPAKTNMYTVQGVSGEAGDGAIKIEVLTDGVLDSGYPHLVDTAFGRYNDGVTTFEFDIRLNTVNDQLLLIGPYLWNNKYILVSGGKYQSITNKDATTEWTHIKMVTNAITRKISFWVDGELLTDNADYGTNGEFNNNVFDFGILQLSSKGEGQPHSGFSLDNFEAENVSFYMPAEATVSDDGIDLYVEAGIASVSKEQVSLTTSLGETINVEDVTLSDDGKEISVKADLPAGSDIDVILSKDIGYADGKNTLERNNVMRVHTTDSLVSSDVSFTVNSNELLAQEQIKSGETVRANISYENVSGQNTDILYVLTLRKDNRLVAISAKSLPDVEAGASATTSLSVDVPEDIEGCEVMLMICDNLQNGTPIAQYVHIK